MNLVATLIGALAMILPVRAAQERFFIGTYTQTAGRSKGIYVGTLDTDTGKLGPLRLAAKETDPCYLAFSPDRRFLFAAMKEAVCSFAVQSDGTLREINRQVEGGGCCYVSVDSAGREVFVANYGAGTISGFPVKADGTLGPRAAFETFTGSGPNKARQQSPHAHSIYADAEGRFVYACDLGTDSIWIFHRDTNGGLAAAAPAVVKVAPGSGPRHLVIDGDFVYVVNEMALTVSVFQRDVTTGALKLLQTVNNVPSGALPDSTSAELALHPTGKWLYVSTRTAEVMTVFCVDRTAKQPLAFMQNIASPVKFPRAFGLDPSGRWMIVAGQNDHRIAVMKIDATSGQLSTTSKAASVGSPVCVLFATPQ